LPGQPLPDHGKQEYDAGTFHGGSYTRIRPQFYRNTVLQDFRAPEFGDYDVLEAVLPSARKRGMKTICWFEDVFRDDTPNIRQLQEKTLDGRNATTLCFNNPTTGAGCWARWKITPALTTSTASCGAPSARAHSPMPSARATAEPAGIRRVSPASASSASARRESGASIPRGPERIPSPGHLPSGCAKGKRPVDGYYVTMWRLLLRYPELLAWEMLWTDSLRETYAAMYKKVKEIKPSIGVGWHIWHNNSFSPIYRAEQDLTELSKYSDFLKMVMYHNCGGERLASYIGSVGGTIYGDVPHKSCWTSTTAFWTTSRKKPVGDPRTGLSADYVYREAKRAREALNGTRTQLWPGIDIDIPTNANSSKSTPAGTRDAVMAAFRAGSDGVILSRKYSEMKLANLAGAGAAIRQLGLG